MKEKSTASFELSIMPGELSISRLAPGRSVPAWANSGSIHGILVTPDEMTVICSSEAVPDSVRSEKGWRCFQVRGPLDFSQTGVLSKLAAPLAAARVSIFALSTFDTDYILVRAIDLEKAVQALESAGHKIVSTN